VKSISRTAVRVALADDGPPRYQRRPAGSIVDMRSHRPSTGLGLPRPPRELADRQDKIQRCPLTLRQATQSELQAAAGSLAVIVLSQLMVVLDTAIVNVALPSAGDGRRPARVAVSLPARLNTRSERCQC
jgi:hypothetical protein